MIGAVSQFGKVGVVSIGNTPEEAEAIYQATVAVLDRETSYGRAGSNPAEPKSFRRRPA
jgi:hypothetical protein